jgi:hypothetical protein
MQIVATSSCLNLGIAFQGRAAAISPLPAVTRGEADARSAAGEGKRKPVLPQSPHPPPRTSAASPRRGEARILASA